MSTPDIHVHKDDARGDAARATGDTGVTGLFTKLMADTSDLVRGEVHLARAEVRESVNEAKKGLISLVAGAVVLLAGLPLLMFALVYGITALTGLALGLSFLIVGLVFSAIGALMLKSASSKLSAETLAPSRTAASLSKDRRMVEEQVR